MTGLIYKRSDGKWTINSGFCFISLAILCAIFIASLYVMASAALIAITLAYWGVVISKGAAVFLAIVLSPIWLAGKVRS